MRWDPRSAIILDTNVLLVLIVGLAAPNHVGRVGRTEAYDPADFELLYDFLAQYKYAVTTPHILSETNNLVCKGASGPLVQRLLTTLQRVFQVTDERFVPARVLSKDASAFRLGLADTSLVEAARCGCTVLSDDAELYNELQRRGLRALNFNHIRFREIAARD